MIPLVHDFEGKIVLIFGGGSVGARRARMLSDVAWTIVVSPRFADRSFGSARLVRAKPTADDVATWIDRADPALVIAATDDAIVNGAIVESARDAGALANRADRGDSDVIIPAVARDDPVSVAVSTGGASPALSGYLRRRIEDRIEGAGAMADLVAGLRDELPSEDRPAAMRAVVESERVWSAIEERPVDAERIAREEIRRARGTGSE